MRSVWRLWSKPPSPSRSASSTLLAGVAEGRVAEVVREHHRLGEVLVHAQRARDGARDLAALERVREPVPVVVALVVDEDLRLVLEPAERARVHDAVAVALERGAVGVLGLAGGRARASAPARCAKGARRSSSSALVGLARAHERVHGAPCSRSTLARAARATRRRSRRAAGRRSPGVAPDTRSARAPPRRAPRRRPRRASASREPRVAMPAADADQRAARAAAARTRTLERVAARPRGARRSRCSAISTRRSSRSSTRCRSACAGSSARENALTLPLSATGSAGMEACLANLLERGDDVVIGVAGVFGERMCEVAARIGARVTRVEAEPGTALDAAGDGRRDRARAAARRRVRARRDLDRRAPAGRGDRAPRRATPAPSSCSTA